MLQIRKTSELECMSLQTGDDCSSGNEEVASNNGNDEVCFIGDFGSKGTTDGKFDEPAGLAFDETSDFLYVADTENDRIQVFEIISGTTCPSNTDEIIDGVCFVEEFGSSGSSDGRFNSPSGLAIDTDNDFLYVADTENNRIQVIAVPANTDGTSSGTNSGTSSSSNEGTRSSKKNFQRLQRHSHRS